MQDLLAPPALCQLDCRDAMPRNDAMAAALEWRPVLIGPVQGAVPSRDAGLDTRAFSDALLSAASRDDGIAVSRLLDTQLHSQAGQAWLQTGLESLERQSPAAPARSTPAMPPAHEMDGLSL